MPNIEIFEKIPCIHYYFDDEKNYKIDDYYNKYGYTYTYFEYSTQNNAAIWFRGTKKIFNTWRSYLLDHLILEDAERLMLVRDYLTFKPKTFISFNHFNDLFDLRGFQDIDDNCLQRWGLSG